MLHCQNSFCNELFSILVDLILHGDFVSVPEGNATFTCISIHLIVHNVSWFFDDYEVKPESRQDVVIDLLPIGTNIGRLELLNISSTMNATRIRCTAGFSGGVLYSEENTLKLQGCCFFGCI
jgi:hypothetical protein